ncbi:MAG: hypothetical protein IJE89_02490 [Bacilli bacterium]|nr:hypothetical protein [Bacilli bacterium]
MKVIFLDFDGVVNNWNNFDGVDINNVLPLLEIVKMTGAKIVATSSNKYSFQVNGVKYDDSRYSYYVSELKKLGIDIFDVTPYLEGNREKEIAKYLEEHPEIEDFLILDDDYVINSLKKHQVFLDLYMGITKEHVEPSVRILNGKLGFYPPDFNFDETLEERNIRINQYHSRKR